MSHTNVHRPTMTALAAVLALAWQHWPLVWVLLGIGGTCYVLVYAQLARQAAHA